ncbi:carboxylesterase [Breznakibacter xylanolyticus]|uniref:Carboxylesterase n=1 Tax=Breznakibacter xylanolyticus TaxID=990 RepID=A0A2W7ND08_9BACT|nr:esterase [Breznakibacter xylanolyticus]PZX17860.1 carboxylesterase [Breznakibacter xylanolyticus]
MPLHFKTLGFIALLWLTTACNLSPDIDDAIDLDGTQIYDPSLAHPEQYLLSYQHPAPTSDQLNLPVAITVHGFSASTWEWDEFCQWSHDRGQLLTSQVLLGGHGIDYQAFKTASWGEWQRPILEEYQRLEAMGYKHLYLAGSSTGATLILELMASGKLAGSQRPESIIMIDPIIIPSNKFLSLVGFVGPIMGFVETPLDEAENGHYYKYRPHEALNQLLRLTDRVRHDLEDDITLPPGTTLTVYKSLRDASADPVSALLLYKGISTSAGKPTVKMVDSDLHVFTYLKGSNNVSEHDKTLQNQTFMEMEAIMHGR